MAETVMAIAMHLFTCIHTGFNLLRLEERTLNLVEVIALDQPLLQGELCSSKHVQIAH
jgi:hypothetical protein